MKKTGLTILALFAMQLVSFGASPFETASRTWIDSTGSFKIEATFVSFERGRVTLRPKSGKEIAVPFGRLSSDDQNYVQKLTRRTSLNEGGERKSIPSRPTRAKIDSKPDEMYGIKWQDSVDDAVKIASMTNDKPIMWFRVLGDLNGLM